MSREIKFRAWITVDVDWEDNDIKEMTYDLAFEKYAPINDLLNRVDALMQYTGLKDKNGKEIYKGDICKVWGHPQLNQNFEYDAVVIWQQYSAGFKFEKILPPKVMWDIGHNTCEIIGNIYETPELLTKPQTA